MPSIDLRLTAYLRDASQIRDPATVQRFLDEVAALGYQLAGDGEEAYTEWQRSLRAAGDAADASGQRLAPGHSAVLDTQVRAYLAGERAELRCQAFSVSRQGPRRGMMFSLWLMPEDGSIQMGMDARGFLRDDGLQQEKHWLTLARLVYRVWHPFYAYSSAVAGELAPEVTRAEALSGAIPTLYEHNLWGPEIVERFGRARILSTPAIRVLPLDDGGVLLVTEMHALTPPPGRSQIAAFRHFGFTHPAEEYAADAPGMTGNSDGDQEQLDAQMERLLREEPDAL